jgi:hypothetical protein
MAFLVGPHKSALNESNSTASRILAGELCSCSLFDMPVALCALSHIPQRFHLPMIGPFFHW